VKQTRTKNKISGHVIRSAAYAVAVPLAFIALSSAFNSPNRWQKSGWVIRARETTRGLPNGVSKVRFPFAFVFTVTNTNDIGLGSLRQAILDSNANPGPPGTTNLIEFNISGSGVHTIMPATQLPDIVEPVMIDGYTQPGSMPNTNPPGQGDNAVILIELSGAIAPPGSSGLTIDADECGVRGLVINQFHADAIDIGLNIIALDGIIEGNFIGTNATGTAALPNGGGVVLGSNQNNTIGGTTPAARNLISGNIGDGVVLGGSASVQGNFIGTDVTGSMALGNGQRGVTSGGGNLIGGDTAAAGNVISGNNRGIELGSGDTVQGNFIGTDLTGTIAVPNVNIGVNDAVGGNTIGGLTSTPGIPPGNLISDNGIAGLVIAFPASGDTVQGNIIGADITGTQPLGNDLGISIVHTGGCTIGGTDVGTGNIVAFNGTLCEAEHAGVLVTGSDATGNRIEGNSIFSNGGLGIDLFMVFDGPCGITDNDTCDTDIGPNNLQNYPVLTSATSGGGETTIQGSLNSAPNTTFRIEFFDNDQCHPSGHGSGETFIGSTDVITDGNCNAPINVTFQVTVEGGHVITATATDPGGNTSEFSACVPVNSGGPTPTGTPSPTPTGTPSPTPTGTPVCQSITSGDAIWYLGIAGSYQITVSGGNPSSYNATQLPPGLTVNTNTGVISGTPTTANTYFPILSATFSTCTVFKTVSFTVTRFTPAPRPTPPPNITPVPPPPSPRPTPRPRPSP
jgi:Putative Ig domain